MSGTTGAGGTGGAIQREMIFGHPKGLYTLFFTELWERFSYYGMRGLLVLYMTDSARGGLALGEGFSGAIYGLYTFGVYALSLPGGWVADKLIGKKKSVLWGGVIIALGHYVLAIPSVISFYFGLFLVMIGTGLLKPNVSAVVGDLYVDKGPKRDAGFSIFYSGINIGAFAGPLVCSYLGESVDWHLGFGAAGVGMTFAVIMYILGQKHLVGAGDIDDATDRPWTAFWGGVGLFLAVVAGLTWLVTSGTVDVRRLAGGTGLTILAIVVLYLFFVLTVACKDKAERSRVGVIIALFIGAALFWSGFEQAGSTFNLFAANNTDRMIGGWEMPAGWLQSVNPLFIILLAPVVGNLWVHLGARNPSIPVKFFVGLALLGVGFFVLAWGATYVDEGTVGMQWLVVTYFFHSVGELCLSPVGLSSVTKLSPDRLVSQMMGLWFMGSAIGNLIAGLVTGYIETMPQWKIYIIVGANSLGAALLFLVMSPILARMTRGIK